MNLQIDKSKVYAIALEGGGAKGCYEVGVWKALDEAGIQYNAVSGSSVGALNGAMMVMHELPKAIELWENITYSQIMNIDDGVMERIFSKDIKGVEEVKEISNRAYEIAKEGGFDITPLRTLLQTYVDEECLRNSDVNFYLVTFSVSDRKELDIDIKDIEKGKIHEMLLASAYFPGFKNEKLSGKRYADGGFQDVFPLNSLVSLGYTDIIAIRVYGWGIERRVTIPENVNLVTIAPLEKLGHILDFNAIRSKKEITLGYFDALRILYGLVGERYYLERTYTEREAYAILSQIATRKSKREKRDVSIREINEKMLPKLAKELQVKGDYYQMLLAYMEIRATELAISEFEVRTDRELLDLIRLEQKRLKRMGNE